MFALSINCLNIILECIGPVCNYCTVSHFLPNITILEAVVISIFTLKVTWTLLEDSVLNRTYSITDAKFL